MDKKLFRSLLLLITYTVLLIMLIVNRQDVAAALKTLLATFRPFIIGFAIAFILAFVISVDALIIRFLFFNNNLLSKGVLFVVKCYALVKNMLLCCILFVFFI